MALDARMAVLAFCIKMNGTATGNVDKNTKRNYAHRAPPVRTAQPRVVVRFRQFAQPQLYRLEFCRLHDRGDD
jgi:hypothetical protein